MQRETKLKDKDKQAFSGSIEEKTQIEKESPKELKDFKIKSKSLNLEIDMAEIEETLQKLLDSEWDEEVMTSMSAPTYMLSLKSDIEFFYSLNRKTFVPVKNKSEVVPIADRDLDPEAPANLNNYFAINNEIFDIDPEKVICIGWN